METNDSDRKRLLSSCLDLNVGSFPLVTDLILSDGLGLFFPSGLITATNLFNTHLNFPNCRSDVPPRSPA